MDLSQYNTTAASDVPQSLSLRDPFTQRLLKDEDGNPVTIELYGLRSTHGRNAQAERQRRSSKDMGDEEAARVGAEYLAALTAGWSKNLELGDGPLTFNRKSAVRLYLEQDWIAQQALDFAADLSNYDPKR